MNRILLLTAALLLALGGPLPVVLAVDYYVSGTGSDANGGLSSGDAFRTITKAMTVAGAGDKVIVEAGNYDAGAGEAFPITVPNGLELAGPGDGSAAVYAGGAPMAFHMAGGGGASVLSGLTITNPGGAGIEIGTGWSSFGTCSVVNNEISVTGDGIRKVSDARGSFFISSNTIMPLGTSWQTGIYVGEANLVFASVRNNLIDGNGTGSGVFISATYNDYLSAEIVGNQISGCMDGIYLSFDYDDEDTSATNYILLQSNTVTNNFGDGLEVSFEITWSDTIDVFLSLSAVSNVFASNSSSGMYMTVSVTSDTDTADMTFYLARNDFRNNGNAGMRWDLEPEETDDLIYLSGTVECNRFASNGSSGVQFNVWGNYGVLHCPMVFRYNEMMDNQAHGFALWASSYWRGLDCVPQFFGNTITGNGEDGVALTTSFSGSSPVFQPDFGGPAAPGGIGRNTIQDNDTAATGNSDFFLSATVDTPDIRALGNWWGTADPEPNVWHSVDGTPNGTVDFGSVLSDPLIFTASLPTLAGVVTVTPNALTPFVEKAGFTPIVVTVNGVPGTNIVVAADGSSLSFTAPLLPAGAWLLFIQNPGGQSGSLMLKVLSGRISRCFVATAAFGDDEAPEVRLLRRWRDESLSGSALGRQLVKAYYAVSPPLAEAVTARPWARSLSRAALTPVVGAVRLWLEARWLYGLAGLMVLLRLVRRRG